jgi:CBS domain-containing protein
MAQQRTPQRRSELQQRTAETPSAATTKSTASVGKPSKQESGKSAGEATRASSELQTGNSPGAARSNLKELLDELGSASEAARLQLHLLAVQARQRTSELSPQLERVERSLDRGLHQALSTAADGARQLSKALQASFGSNPPDKSAQIRVGAVMTDTVQACSPDDSLHRPAEIMWNGDCGSVPVIDSARHVCGIITDRDICMAAFTKGLPLSSIRVGDVMSHNVHHCAPNDTLERAIGIMAEAEVRRLPVIAEDGKLRGIVSLADIANGAALLGHREAEAIVFRLLGTLSKSPLSVRHPLSAAE